MSIYAILRSEAKSRCVYAVGGFLASRLAPALDLHTESDARRVAEALRLRVVRSLQIGNRREPQVPLLVEIRRLGQTPQIVHRAVNSGFDALAAFNPVTLNLLLAVLATVGLLSLRDIPSARRCLRTPPKQQPEENRS